MIRQWHSTNSPHYRLVVHGFLLLHQLTVDGRDESTDADAVRDALDAPWAALTIPERASIQGLSADLFSISDSTISLSQEVNQVAQKNLTDAIEAAQRGELERALLLLRRCAKYIFPAHLAYQRSRIWYEAGYPEVAVLFLEHAVKLDPSNVHYRIVLLDSLECVDPIRTQKEAAQIIQEHQKQPAELVIRAAEVAYFAAQAVDELDARKVFHDLITIVNQALNIVSESEQGASALIAWALLAFCHRNLGEISTAVECYSRGLRIDPSNEGLLTGRGILTYGKNSQSIHDFEQSLKLGTELVWPYFFLAHHYLFHSRFEECWRLCERGMQLLSVSHATRSQLSEWSAIAQAEMMFPRNLVRAAFEQAIRLDRSNDTARRNLERFEDTFPRLNPKGWDRRSESSVRAFGQAETKQVVGRG